jgi:putative phosphoribosyl transferase
VRFHDRSDAGRRLAQALLHYKEQHPVVLALPRGGVPVAVEVAAALDAPLDLVLVGKIGVPEHPELTAAAVVDGERAELVVNEDVLAALELPAGYLAEEQARQLAEIERRRARYLKDWRPIDLWERTAIVVDDGIASGTTARAALRAVRRRRPKQVVLAVPLAPPDIISALRAEVDALVCTFTPATFRAIKYFYDDFHQISDGEVIALLDLAIRRFQANSTLPRATPPAQRRA